MALDKHYIGEVGTSLIANCYQDLTGATVTNLLIKKPNGTEVTWAGTIYTISSNAYYVRYATTASDFDQAGVYEGQAYVEKGGGKWKGETFQFVIYNKFD